MENVKRKAGPISSEKRRKTDGQRPEGEYSPFPSCFWLGWEGPAEIYSCIGPTFWQQANLRLRAATSDGKCTKDFHRPTWTDIYF